MLKQYEIGLLNLWLALGPVWKLFLQTLSTSAFLVILYWCNNATLQTNSQILKQFVKFSKYGIAVYNFKNYPGGVYMPRI